MGKKQKRRASLEQILQSTSDTLFPDKLGTQPVKIDSMDCEGDTPLHVLVLRGDRYAVELLIEKGASIDSIGDMGETPLHIALRGEDLWITELLLKANASTTIRSEFGKTARELALNSGGEILKLFRQYDAV